MSNSTQDNPSGNSPEPNLGANGGRKGGLNPELVEHRLNELEAKTKEIAQDVKTLLLSVEAIKTEMKSMITQKQLVTTLITMLALVVVNVLLWVMFGKE